MRSAAVNFVKETSIMKRLKTHDDEVACKARQLEAGYFIRCVPVFQKRTY